MKRLALISVVFLLPLISEAQVSLDSTAYKAFRATIYYNNGESTNFGSDALFYINNGVMLTPGYSMIRGRPTRVTPRRSYPYIRQK